MPIDIRTPQAPGWWLQRLSRKLLDRQPLLNDLIDRFEGNGPLPHVNDSVRDAYRTFQKKSRTNWAELIVEAVRERIVLNGFRTALSGDESADDAAAEIAEANGLAVEFADTLQMMLAAGNGYMIVGRDNDTGMPIITGEDPRQVVTIHDPVRQRVVRAGLKMFHDVDEQRDFAYVYLPGRRFVASRDVKRTKSNMDVRFNPGTWSWDDDFGGEEGESLPEQVVPVVRFRNRRGVGEFQLHRDLLDRIDHMVLQRLVIATFQAFKQRAVKGLPDTQTDADGVEVDIDWADVFSADPGAFFQVPEGVEFWESGQVDLTPLLLGAKDDLRSLAAVSRTALSYLAPDMAAGSAEGATLMREGQLFRTEDRTARAREALKDVMSMAFLFAGDRERADRSTLQPLFADPKRLSLAERADASSKATDIPWRDRMIHIWGFDPVEVDRMAGERAADLLLNQLALPPTT